MEPLIRPDPDARPLEQPLVPMEVDDPVIEPAPPLEVLAPEVEELVPDVPYAEDVVEEEPTYYDE